jgi:hypothetical protein
LLRLSKETVNERNEEDKEPSSNDNPSRKGGKEGRKSELKTIEDCEELALGSTTVQKVKPRGLRWHGLQKRKWRKSRKRGRRKLAEERKQDACNWRLWSGRV